MLEREFKKTFFYSVKRKMTGFAERVLVHFASVIVAIGASKTIYDPLFEPGFMNSAGIAFGIYVGLVCLFPAGNPRRTDWFVPFLSGCALGLVCYLQLMPWQFILFWMGGESWLVRVFCKKTKQSEWLIAPWLGLAVVGFFSKFSGLSAVPSLIVAVPALTVAGYMACHLVNNGIFFPLRKRQLHHVAARLESFLVHERLPLPFQEPMRLLVTNSRLVAQAVPQLDDSMVTPIMALGIIANKLSILVAGDVSRWTTEGERVLQGIRMLNEDFDSRLVQFDTVAIEEEKKEEELDPHVARGDELIELATQIVRKKDKLPQHLHQPLDNVRLMTRGIVDSMLSDPFDYEPGEKFLSRYLPALQKVVDEYIRLYHSVDPGHADVDRVLLRSEEVILRLELAFKREREHLLRNDTMELNAELATLDTLLKIDGR